MANPHLCRGSSDPLGRVRSAEETERRQPARAAVDGHPPGPLLCHPARGHPPVSVALGGAGEGCQGIHLSVRVLSIFCALYAKEALLQPHFLLKTCHLAPPCAFLQTLRTVLLTWRPRDRCYMLEPFFFLPPSSVFLPSNRLGLVLDARGTRKTWKFPAPESFSVQ